jgi:hypothetical protein
MIFNYDWNVWLGIINHKKNSHHNSSLNATCVISCYPPWPAYEPRVTNLQKFIIIFNLLSH